MAGVLIRGAEVWGHGRADLRVAKGRVAAIGALAPLPGEAVAEARGALLLPGLHDHHLHLNAMAAQRQSIRCGPPDVTTEGELAGALRQAPGSGWLRGTGYHESVMGLPDARALDRLVADRPLRIQHRGGRMWLMNSLALEDVLAGAKAPPPGLEREDARYTGRLFDEDAWLRSALASAPPDLAAVSADLAARGVTGVTDMSPQNDDALAAHFAGQRQSGALAQRLILAGSLALAGADKAGWSLGPAKLHLHEAALPDFDAAAAFIRAAHDQGRGVAVHCVTEVELVFTLALFEAAGMLPGDRIEHASIADPHHIARMASMGLAVCVQPHFIAERGDHYLTDVEPEHHANLYRLRSLAEAGLALAGGSDAPFGSCDPWAAMAAAVSRRTPGDSVIGSDEAMTPEQALALYLADPADLRRQTALAVGNAADLCLLAQPWAALRGNLGSAEVALTLIGGKVVYQRVDQPPFERFGGADPLA